MAPVKDFIKKNVLHNKFDSIYSKIIGILALLILVSAVSLTVLVVQQQQSIKQKAADTSNVPSCWNQSTCPADYWYYSYFITNGNCESSCGETSDASSLCYDPACAQTTPTLTPTPTPTGSLSPTSTPTPTQIPGAPTRTPTPTPTPTSTQVSNIILVSAINPQDTTLTSDSLSSSLILYSLLTNNQVSGAPATQPFTRTSIPGRQYSANIGLSNLPQGQYFIIIRKDNMIAKSLFSVSSSIGTITIPTTTLVFGDINGDNKIDIIDYEAFRNCWKKPATGTCSSSDFDGSEGNIDQIDYNTWLRGLATWQKEAQGL
jgi:hypothetical protein